MSKQLQLAEAVRDACLRAALRAYENAGISGLCGEGRWEMAVQALRGLDLRPVVDAFQGDGGRPPDSLHH
jgi:hypothetical protein